MKVDFFQSLQPPVFHISKEQIRAYYHGWVLGKGSIWKDEIGTHILECAQVVREYDGHKEPSSNLHCIAIACYKLIMF